MAVAGKQIDLSVGHSFSYLIDSWVTVTPDSFSNHLSQAFFFPAYNQVEQMNTLFCAFWIRPEVSLLGQPLGGQEDDTIRYQV